MPRHLLPAPTHEPEINYHASIKNWSEGERPREKLMARGAQALIRHMQTAPTSEISGLVPAEP